MRRQAEAPTPRPARLPRPRPHEGKHRKDGPLTATAIAKGLGGRSAGAVANCLTRLAEDGKVRQAKRSSSRLRPQAGHGAVSSGADRGGHRTSGEVFPVSAPFEKGHI